MDIKNIFNIRSFSRPVPMNAEVITPSDLDDCFGLCTKWKYASSILTLTFGCGDDDRAVRDYKRLLRGDNYSVSPVFVIYVLDGNGRTRFKHFFKVINSRANLHSPNHGGLFNIPFEIDFFAECNSFFQDSDENKPCWT